MSVAKLIKQPGKWTTTSAIRTIVEILICSNWLQGTLHAGWISMRFKLSTRWESWCVTWIRMNSLRLLKGKKRILRTALLISQKMARESGSAVLKSLKSPLRKSRLQLLWSLKYRLSRRMKRRVIHSVSQLRQSEKVL